MPDDYEYVNGIEVLSTLCDERGLKHWDSEAMACETHIFVDKAGNPHECWEAPDGMVNVVISMTPEQAVDATLGRETCKEVYLLMAMDIGDGREEVLGAYATEEAAIAAINENQFGYALHHVCKLEVTS